MKQLANAKKNGAFLYGGCICVVILCWNIGSYVTAELSKIQPHQLQQFATKPIPPGQITFTPYQSAAPKESASTVADDSNDFDDVFRTKPEPKVDVVSDGTVQAPKEVKYPELVRQNLSIDSVLDNGAVLNGRFTPTGSVAEQLTVMGPAGQRVAPTLSRVSRNRITLAVGTESFDVPVMGFGGNQ